MTTVNGMIPALSGNEDIWLFQSNLPEFSIAKTLEGMEVGQVATWYVQDHLDELRGGDLALLWEEGTDAGLYALATLVGEPYEGEPVVAGGPKAKWMRWRLDATITPPITKQALQAHHALAKLKHFDKRDATNLPVEKDEWDALKEILLAEAAPEPPLGN